MNAEQFFEYLSKHKGEALVGNPQTQKVADQMLEKNFLTQIGEKDGKPFYRLTSEGVQFVEYSLKKLGKSKGETVKKILNGLDGYIQAFKQEHPVGVEDIRHVGSLFGDWSQNQPSIALPTIEPMRLDAPHVPAIEQKKKKSSNEFVKVNGKLYKRVEED